MKKLMATLFVLTFAMSTLVGCGDKKEEAPADAAVKVEEPAAEPANEPAMDEKKPAEGEMAEAPAADSGDMEKMEKEEAK